MGVIYIVLCIASSCDWVLITQLTVSKQVVLRFDGDEEVYLRFNSGEVGRCKV